MDVSINFGPTSGEGSARSQSSVRPDAPRTAGAVSSNSLSECLDEGDDDEDDGAGGGKDRECRLAEPGGFALAWYDDVIACLDAQLIDRTPFDDSLLERVSIPDYAIGTFDPDSFQQRLGGGSAGSSQHFGEDEIRGDDFVAGIRYRAGDQDPDR